MATTHARVQSLYDGQKVQSFGGILSMILSIVRLYPRHAVVIAVLAAAKSVAESIALGLTLPLLRAIATLEGGAPAGDVGGASWLLGPADALVAMFPDRASFLRVWGLAFLGATILIAGLRYGIGVLTVRFVAELSERIRREMMQAYLRADYQFFLDRRQGRLLDDLAVQPQATSRVLGMGLAFLSEVCTVVALVAVLVAISWPLTLVAAALGGLGALALERLRLRAWTIGKDTVLVRRALHNLAAETIAGIRQVKLFATETRVLDENRVLGEERERLLRRAAMLDHLPPSLVIASLGISIAGAMLVLPLLDADGQRAAIPLLGAFGLVAVRLLPALAQLVTTRLNLFQQSAGLEFSLAILGPRDAPATAQAAAPARPFRELREGIVFRDVSFSYGHSEFGSRIPQRIWWADEEAREAASAAAAAVPVLHHVDLEIPRGKRTAIVGPSGAGKSTIVDLLVRLFEIQDGRITVDGTDLKELALDDWRRAIGYVSQDTFLFNGTLRDNIALAVPDASPERIRQAAETADLLGVVAGLPLGLETRIGDRGMKLSGGQRQRVAMARAVLLDPPILILDEATSSLDVVTERAVQAGLDAASAGRTVIVIAHRLATVATCDRIYVLDGGRVVDAGTHEELLVRCPFYASGFAASVGAGARLV